MEFGDLTCDWTAPPAQLNLPQNTVHLWNLSLEQAAVHTNSLHETLTPDERARAARFRFPRDRDAYVGVRGAVRDILSRYMHQPPESIQLSYGPHGKPQLATTPSVPSLHFNCSRSGASGLFAIARYHQVGIDIEMIRPCDDYDAIIGNYFSPREIGSIHALPQALRLNAFLKYWTRKEAVSKALGSGLGLDWTSFDVTPAPAERVTVTVNGTSSWAVYSLIPSPGYLGALAYEGTNPVLQFWTWSGLYSRSSTVKVQETDWSQKSEAMSEEEAERLLASSPEEAHDRKPTKRDANTAEGSWSLPTA